MKKWWGFWIIPASVLVVFALCGRFSHVSDRDLSDRSKFSDYEVTYCVEKRSDDVFVSQQRESFEKSEYIAVVKCVGSPENTYSAINQKIEVLQVLQGDASIEGSRVDYLAVGCEVYGERKLFYGTYVNLMKEGEYYLICMDKIADGYLKNAFRCSQYCGMGWLAIESFHMELPPDPEVVMYRDVAEMDGFVRDTEGMAILKEFRRKMLEKYLTGTEWRQKVQDLY